VAATNSRSLPSRERSATSISVSASTRPLLRTGPPLELSSWNMPTSVALMETISADLKAILPSGLTTLASSDEKTSLATCRTTSRRSGSSALPPAPSTQWRTPLKVRPLTSWTLTQRPCVVREGGGGGVGEQSRAQLGASGAGGCVRWKI